METLPFRGKHGARAIPGARSSLLSIAALLDFSGMSEITPRSNSASLLTLLPKGYSANARLVKVKPARRISPRNGCLTVSRQTRGARNPRRALKFAGQKTSTKESMKYTDEGILKVIGLHHNPDEWHKSGHVYQIWEDGEITLQKCGEWFNQRNLHCISGGGSRIVPMPIKAGNHSYAFMPSMEIADAVQAMF